MKNEPCWGRCSMVFAKENCVLPTCSSSWWGPTSMWLRVILCTSKGLFDKVFHQRFLTKLRRHGIKGHVLFWISKWLKKRKQVVAKTRQASWGRQVSSEVPQKTSLGIGAFQCIHKWLGNTGSVVKAAKLVDNIQLFRVVTTHNDHEEIKKDPSMLGEWPQNGKWRSM